jgi:hypothetical protein
MDLPKGRTKTGSSCRLCRNQKQNERRKANPTKTKELEKRSGYNRRKRAPEKLGFNHGITQLRKVFKSPVLLEGGWPDAGTVETKIGTDYLGVKQWIRAAWLKKHHKTDVQILWAKTYEAAVLGPLVLYKSIEEYIKSFKHREALRLWRRLLKMVPR